MTPRELAIAEKILALVTATYIPLEPLTMPQERRLLHELSAIADELFEAGCRAAHAEIDTAVRREGEPPYWRRLMIQLESRWR